MNKVVLFAGTDQTRETLASQLKEYLPDYIKLSSFAIDEYLPELLPDGLIVISSRLAYEELLEFWDLDKISSRLIIARRTIDFDALDELFFLPEGSPVIFVNDVKEAAINGIEALEEVGLDHLELIPFYPGLDENEIQEARLALTPGEVDKVPGFVEEVIDIGPRLMDYTTIVSILNSLGILENQANRFSNKYLQKIIKMGKKLAHSAREINRLNSQLNQIINGLNEAVLVYNPEGKISVATGQVRELLDLGDKDLQGRAVQDIIYRKDLLSFLMNIEQEEKEIFALGGTSTSVNKFYLSESDNIIAVFQNVQETLANNRQLKQDLINRGYYARYTFKDIIGTSNKIKKARRIAKKLAETELTILLEGETGTGKELFAGAIHNASNRREGPFLAVNFSALHDDLIESELFGYEEGAFTGAKKGGKAGLFEQAESGTIFLDEIGDVSKKVQARLLRVLQEKEVMRIGSNEIKPVDVRIIAATNKNIASLVEAGEFRQDLYYRLKTGYIRIPPLRERKGDIRELLDYFIEIESAHKIEITNEVIDELLSYNWYGNIRELKNILSYMLAVSDDNYLNLEDIPDPGFFQIGSQEKSRVFDDSTGLEDSAVVKGSPGYAKSLAGLNNDLNKEELYILKKIKEIRAEGDLVGRKTLAESLKGSEYELTEYQVRNRLVNLEDKGYLERKRGRHGTLLSGKAKKLLN